VSFPRRAARGTRTRRSPSAASTSKKTLILGSGETTGLGGAEEPWARAGARHHHCLANYDYKLDNPLNREFVEGVPTPLARRNPDFFFESAATIGMHVIYEALKKTGGNTDGEALIGRPPGRSGQPAAGCRSIPRTRDACVQTIYIRRVSEGRRGIRQRCRSTGSRT